MHTFTPNQEKWLQALESGEYNQTSGLLADSNGFCCLGVACNLAVLDGVEIGVVVTLGPRDWWSISYDESVAMLPRRAADWLGLRSSATTVVSGDVRAENLNDERRYSFAQIASHIRAYGIDNAA